MNSPCWRRPRNPRETNRSVIQATFSRMKFAIRSTPSPLFRFEKLKGQSPRILVASRSLTRSACHDPSSDEARRRARLASRYGAMHALRQRRRARDPSSVAAHRIDASWSTSRCPPRSRAPSPKTSAETQFLRATPRPAAFAPARLLGARWALGTRTHGGSSTGSLVRVHRFPSTLGGHWRSHRARLR